MFNRFIKRLLWGTLMSIFENAGLALVVVCFAIPTLYQILYSFYYIAGLNYGKKHTLGFNNELRKIGVSIIVSMKNEPLDKIETLVKNFINSRLSTYGELIAVSHDDYDYYLKIKEVVDKAKGSASNVILMWREGGKGFKAGAINAALWLARNDYVFVVDIDSSFSEDLVYRALDLMERDPKIVAVTSRWRGLNCDTKVSEALWFIMEFEVNSLYRGRYALSLPVFTLGAGTLYRRDYMRNVLKGWSEDNIVEDIDAGLRIILNGHKTAYLDDQVILVEVTRKISSLKIQQERWAYGALYTFKKYFFRLLASSINPFVKLELSLYLNQYLASALFFIGVVAMSALSIILRRDLVISNIHLISSWFISFALFSLCLAHVVYSSTRDVWKTLVVLGRAGVIHNYLSFVFIKSTLRCLLGLRLEFKRTPKGEFEKKLLSKPLTEPVLATFFLVLTVVLLMHGLIFVAGFPLMFTLTYVYPYVRRSNGL